MPKPPNQRIGCWVFLALLLVAIVIGWREYQRLVREEPELFPWTELALADPIGPFTARKLADLGNEPQRCRALLTTAGLAETAAPVLGSGEINCRVQDGVHIRAENDRSIDYAPGGLVTACPVAAALALWEREVVQPAARRHFRTRISRIDHAGSFSCRRLYGRASGAFSEHATADAIDITGFRLSDGTRISVQDDWQGAPENAAFLREVRDGACGLFSTVLSPDYNAAHADHFHLDQAERGATGRQVCR